MVSRRSSQNVVLKFYVSKTKGFKATLSFFNVVTVFSCSLFRFFISSKPIGPKFKLTGYRWWLKYTGFREDCVLDEETVRGVKGVEFLPFGQNDGWW